MTFRNERFLVEAIEQCQLPKILVCYKHQHNLRVHNIYGQNLLVHLLKKQHHHQDENQRRKRFQIFVFLIQHAHLSVHQVDTFGKNLFNWACHLHCVDEALYLLRSYPGDIDILRRDQSGSSSLHYAIEHGNETLVRAIIDYLLQYRIRFDLKDAYRNTPEELAKKLGYEQLADYLADTSRSTIFLGRELPSHQSPRPSSNKSKLTNKTTLTSFSSASSTVSSTSADSAEFYSIIEAKIDKAKQMNDWKLVASLRAYQRNPQGRKIHQLPSPTAHPDRSVINTPAWSTHLPPIRLPRVSTSQADEMLNLIQPQLTTSYRQAFIPHYERPVINNGNLPGSLGGRKLSQASSRRLSMLPGLHRRESNASQMGGLGVPGPNGQNRLSLPPAFKQHRPSAVSPRLSDSEAMMKLHAKHSITMQN